MFRRLRAVETPKTEPGAESSFGLAACHLLSAIEDGLEPQAPRPAPLRSSQQLRQALGAAHTGQVVAAVGAQLARMRSDWLRCSRVPHLAVQARVLLQLLAELGDFPALPGPDRLATERTEPDGGPCGG